MSDDHNPSLEESAFAVSEYCQDRHGDAYRATIVYRDDGLHAYHLRSELHGAYSEERLEEFADAAWDVQVAIESFAQTDSPLDDIAATTHTFEDAIVVQFHLQTDGGILVSFDEPVGGQFAEFIEELRQIVTGAR